MPTADVVIIGAGVTGCAVAAHLLRLAPEISVTLVDRHHVGAGSTSRSTAAFRHQWSVPAHIAFSRYASDEYDRLIQAGYLLGFHRNGYLFLFTDPEELTQASERVDRQRTLGVRGVEVLGPGELASQVPCGSALDLTRVVGATWGPTDGFLDPLAVTQAYLAEARNASVTYLPDSPVTELLMEKSRATGVRIGADKKIHSPHIINCAGIWSDSVARLAGLSLPIRPAKRFLYHSHPVRDLDVSRWPMTIDPQGAHLRPSEGNTLMMAWEHLPKVLPGCPPASELWERQDVIDEGFGVGADSYGIRILAALSELLPVLAEKVSLSKVTCGWYIVTPDHKAILGEDPRLRGLYHATGFSGHGIMHAAATGLVLSELVLGRSLSLVAADELEAQFGLAPLLERGHRKPVEDMVL